MLSQALFCLQICLNSSRHRWKPSPEILVDIKKTASEFCAAHPWWDSSFHHILNVIIPVGLGSGDFEYSEAVWYDWIFVTCCIFWLEVAIRRWVHRGHTGMGVVSNNTQVGLEFKLCSCGRKAPKAWQEVTRHVDHVFYTRFWAYHVNLTAKIKALRVVNVFLAFWYHFWWGRANCSLFLADMSSIRVDVCCSS